MQTFQLDQCLDSKRFVRDCMAEGLCRLLRLPIELRDTEDPQLLNALMASANTLLTFDRSLPQDHASAIPDEHPGFIVISNFPEPQTITVKIAQRVLARFKSYFSQWHEVDWRNSIVEIITIGVEIRHVVRSQLLQDGYLALESDELSRELLEHIRRNANRRSS